MDFSTLSVGHASFHLALCPFPYYPINKYCSKEVIEMWKYITLEQCNQFLLSLNLIDYSLSNSQKIKLLYTITNNLKTNYTIYKIKKTNGGYRTIYNPQPTLKHIQRQILKNILNNKNISKYATAYYQGTNLKNNAINHVNKEIILKLDIKDFFENISFINVYNSCFDLGYFPKSVGTLLTYLCTYNDHLPQGAPTSPAISNLIMKDFDETIGFWCQTNNITYTRYCDDMTFSGTFDPSKIIKKVQKRLSFQGLELNKDKIHVIPNSQQQVVTGIVVNKKIQTPKNYRKKIRQEIYYLKKFGIISHLKTINFQGLPDQYIANLYGRIMYVLQINDNDQEFIQYKTYLQTYF